MRFGSKVIRWAGTKAWFPVLGRRMLTPLDKLLRQRRQSITSLASGLPMGYLTTVGRISGEPRVAPLLYLTSISAIAVVVGTNFGGDDHPQWTANLLANPRAHWKVEDGIAVLARQATDEEYATLWRQFVAMWPGYETYVERSQRVPLMFVLEAA